MDTDADENREAKPVRRRFYFTVRELCLLILVVAVAVGWWVDRARILERQKTVAETPRFVSRLTQTYAEVGMTKDELRGALGPPHNFFGSKKEDWVYFFDEENPHYLQIKFGPDDTVVQVRERR